MCFSLLQPGQFLWQREAIGSEVEPPHHCKGRKIEVLCVSCPPPRRQMPTSLARITTNHHHSPQPTRPKVCLVAHGVISSWTSVCYSDDDSAF